MKTPRYADSVPDEPVTWDSPATVTAFKWLVGLHKDGLSPPSTMSDTVRDVPNNFRAGKVAMAMMGPWEMQATKEAFAKQGWEYGMFRAPQGPAGRGEFMYVGALGLFSQSKNDKEVIQYLKYYTSPEGLGLYMKTNGMIPANKQALADPYYAEDPLYRVLIETINNADLHSPKWMGLRGASAHFDSVWTPIYQKMLAGDITPEAGVKQMQELAGEIPEMTLESREAVLPGEAPVRAALTGAGPRRAPLDLFPYFLLAPALLVLAVIFLYPLLHSLWLSFHSLNLNRPWQGTRFVGIDNYTEQLSDPAFYHSLWLTFYWTAGSLVGQLDAGLCCSACAQPDLCRQGDRARDHPHPLGRANGPRRHRIRDDVQHPGHHQPAAARCWTGGRLYSLALQHDVGNANAHHGPCLEGLSLPRRDDPRRVCSRSRRSFTRPPRSMARPTSSSCASSPCRASAPSP